MSHTSELRQSKIGGTLAVNNCNSLIKAGISGLEIAQLPTFLNADANKLGRTMGVMYCMPQGKREYS